ncbi:hypothetical protein LTR22_027326 [Elasticomyces elasticus]|nr:hypothetical protein LTR22_027326 [Elasticomyces elasticus]
MRVYQGVGNQSESESGSSTGSDVEASEDKTSNSDDNSDDNNDDGRSGSLDVLRDAKGCFRGMDVSKRKSNSSGKLSQNYESLHAFLHFLAVLGIDDETGRLRQTNDFSYMLAGVGYCMRALAVEIVLPSAERDQQGHEDDKTFRKMRDEYLADGSYSVMSKMLSLLAYGKSVALSQAYSRYKLPWDGHSAFLGASRIAL